MILQSDPVSSYSCQPSSSVAVPVFFFFFFFTLREKRPVVIDVGNCDMNQHGGIPWWGAVVCR